MSGIMTGVGRVVTAAIALALVGAAPARADVTIQAFPPDTFNSSSYEMDQGEKLFFQNLDLSGHDVTSAEGLFASPLTEPLQTSQVAGAEYLTTGTYPFVCTVHPGMEAVLNVTSAGTPAARPAVKVKIDSRKLKKVRRDGKLKLTISTTAPIKLTVLASSPNAGLGATSVEHAGEGDQKVELKLHKAGRRSLKGKKKLKVTVTAKGSGAEGKATRTLK